MSERNKKKFPRSKPEKINNPAVEQKLIFCILRLQLELQSKMLEFMRAYQRESNRSGDQFCFQDGYRETRIARLYRETNELGRELGALIERLIGKQVFEKRDDKGRILLPCQVCQEETAFINVVDSPYGLPGAYMADSERLVCSNCREDEVFPEDARLQKFNSIFKTR